MGIPKELLEMLQGLGESVTSNLEFNNSLSQPAGIDDDEMDRHGQELCDLYPIEMECSRKLAKGILEVCPAMQSRIIYSAACMPESVGDFFIKMIVANLKRFCVALEKKWSTGMEETAKRRAEKAEAKAKPKAAA